LYLFIVAIAGKIFRPARYISHPEKKSFALLIPSYKEDDIIVNTVMKAVQHNYLKDRFSVYVIADQLRKETVECLKAIVHVIEVDFSHSMKSRSLNAGLNYIKDKHYDIVMILDADNVMADNCLEKVNDAFHKGCLAVQCHRTAKNLNTPVALLDAISEEININLFRRGPSVLGLSAAPTGSGMAFQFALVRDIFEIKEILDNPAEDREIDFQLMNHNIKMEFIDDAYVYDEKVASSKIFEKQRLRWLEAQLNHLLRLFQPDMKKAPKTILYYNKLLQNLLLPRLLFLILFGCISIILICGQIFAINFLFLPASVWLICLALYSLTLLISIPIKFYSLKTLAALFHIPSLMLSMLRALFKVRKHRKEFLHTPKNVIVK
jgi:cellulose synthase/poly-beta-1,6-N-acetylglucosamine synthase-like glycosyltransferase